ncbi:MAG TPA: LamG domain-containing protein [Blastocatellia bacterium]|nr:LamG domain-containing protein [Blastocatellia bacterium]
MGGALFFPANFFVSVADDPALRFGTSNFSIDAWVASAQPNSVIGIVDKLDMVTTVTKVGYAFYIQNGHLTFVMGNGTPYATTAQVNIVNTGLSWHHVAVTVNRTGGVGTFYVDGAAVATFSPLPSNVDISSMSTLQLGGSRLFATLGEYLLDEIEIFNGVLEAGDVKRIFDAGPSGKCFNIIPVPPPHRPGTARQP